VRKEERTEHMPDVQCRSIENQVCGPEKCPLEKGEEVCFDELRQVSDLITHYNIIVIFWGW
jgi:hypothetical protein